MTIRRSAFAIFFFVAVFLFALHGHRFVLTNDEGILLEPAQRMAEGSRPYIDFFGYMSPGSYWLQAALFRVFGFAYWVGRIPVILDFSLQCALLFSIVARLASQRAAAAATFLFVGFQIADPSFLTAQHRWDSGALALTGVYLALDGRKSNQLKLAASGALCAAAAWCTPSTLLVMAAIAIWLMLARERRAGLLPFATGVAAVTILAAGFLAAQGTLIPLFRQMLWLQKNYARVNVMPYGSVIGGYSRLLEGSGGIEQFVRILIVACLALPAILPPVALLCWAAAKWRKAIPEDSRASIGLLCLAMVAFTATAFPRADLMHLALVAALPYALVAIAVARFLPLRVSAIATFAMIPLAVLFSFNGMAGAFGARTIASAAGKIRVESTLAPEMEKLLAHVHKNDSLFVYPYMPAHYFVTQARNPTAFSYLAPGMMTQKEEAETLAQLQAHPPQWLMYLHLPREEFLRVFPDAKNRDWRFESLENWFAQNYAPLSAPGVNVGGYQLWERIPSAVAVK